MFCAESGKKIRQPKLSLYFPFFKAELHSSCNLARTKTSGANINSFRRAVYNSLNFLNVGFPGSVGPSV